MQKFLKTALLLLFLSLQALAQQQGTQTPTLDGYIQEALQSNEGVKQQSFAIERSLAALAEAKTLFRPQSTFKTDYLLSHGGRTIGFPIGDLLNPVYSTLNQLTNTTKFPQLENQNVQLNPNNFYDAKIRTAMPLYNAEIQYNYKIKQQQVGMREIELNLYKRELVKEVKKAYYQYMQAEASVKIYEEAGVLVAENKRITEKLLESGAGNRTAVTRAENELENIGGEQEKARNNARNAQAYFNFLLNKPLETPITADTNLGENFPAVAGNSVDMREELSKLSLADSITQNSLKLSQSYRLPKVSAFIDLGSQGFNWKVNQKTAYYMFGLSVEMNVFSFGRNTQKVKQAQLDVQTIQSQKTQAEDQLQLQLHVAQNNYKSAITQHDISKNKEESALRFYKDVQKLYKEGKSLFIELLDAQNQYIMARNLRNIAWADVWVKWAEVERANAGYSL